MSRIISIVALTGLAPFLAALVLTVVPGVLPLDPIVFERALIGYGALILSFLGGVRWGIRMQGGAGSDLIFVIGILGSVAGFFTLLLPYTFGLVVLAIGFALQGAWDVWSDGVPAFYSRLRGLLTWLVCFVIIAMLIARALL
jgi:hypothetical protein